MIFEGVKRMVLKSIEIRGFKSFADLTELSFEKGITSIVGPNGSGKSNISDAIRWCLGEQSVKNLRGNRMEDVIFVGTQFRKSLSLAQVSITFDNSNNELPIEYKTVTISRKLYRSGESEYLINNKVCKLKDIHELFYDTGIGKEGYSLIGQGKLESILSEKLDDRRSIIEEAVGITKYKFKKYEAQSKIENTNQNLRRINDILATYLEYLEPLNKEQIKAKKFLELYNRLKEIDILLLSNNLYKISSEMENLNVEILENQKDLDKLTGEKDKFEIERETIENNLEKLILEEKEKTEEYYKIKEDIQSYINELNSENNNVNMLTYSNNINTNQINENLLKLNNIQSKEDIINKTKQELLEQAQEIESYLDGFKNIFETNNSYINDLSLKIETLKSKELDTVNKNANILNKVEFINSKISSSNHEKNNLIKEIEFIKNILSEIDYDVENINFEKINKEKGLTNSQVRLDKLNFELDETEKSIKVVSFDLDNLNKSILTQKTNLDILEQFDNRYEGFNKTSQKLMNEIKEGSLNKFKNNCFIVGELFNSKPQYELAIETAIGSHMSDIVVDDDSIAKHIIEYLKQNNFGRVTFHPINLIRKFIMRKFDNIKEQKGFVDFAINLVDVNQKFIEVARNILGNTIICDNIENVINIAKFINFSSRIITMDSQVINAGGSITGGSSYSKNITIINRKKKILDQRNFIEQGLIKVKNLDEKLLFLKDKRKKLDADLKNLDLHTQNLKLDIVKLNSSLDIKHNLKTNELQKFDKKNLDLKDLDNTILSNETEIKNLNHEFKNNEKLLEDLKRDIENINNELDVYRNEIKNEEDKIVVNRIKKAKLEENISNISQEIQRIILDKEEIIFLNKKLKLECENINEKISEHEINIENLQKNIDDLTIKNKENEKKFDNYVLIKDGFKNNIKELNTYIDDFKQEIYKMEAKKNSISIKFTKLEVEFNTLNEKLLNEYNIEFDRFSSDKYMIETSKIKLYNDEKQILKSGISELGIVNLKSIEEYEELNKKVKFITKQKEDLDKSKIELEQFIDEITMEMRKIFNENFKVINENFNTTFRELFKGGNASLLLGEGDELESSIEIIVQPPGKKLQNLNLLSGGEKGLSAISLLFAILKMKPAPFCLLDEIEASLDDSNVLKFAEFLKKTSQGIQFIVITHKKTVMEFSDVIYGVTMQEKGISKIVSINLANYEI